MHTQSWLKAFFLITSSFAYILQTRDIKTATLSASASTQRKNYEGTEKNLQALANISTVLQECINVTDYTMGYTWIMANTDTQKNSRMFTHSAVFLPMQTLSQLNGSGHRPILWKTNSEKITLSECKIIINFQCGIIYAQ